MFECQVKVHRVRIMLSRQLSIFLTRRLSAKVGNGGLIAERKKNWTVDE